MTIRLTIVCFTGMMLIGLFLLLWYQSNPVQIAKNTTLDFPLSEEVKDILYSASLAPNSHNAQMWQVYVDDSKQQMAVCLDKQRLLPAVDPDNREAYISLGAFLENMRQAFIAQRYDVTMSIDADERDNAEVMVRVDYRKNNQTADAGSVFALIEKRHTDKRMFLDKTIDTADIQQLLDQTPGLFYFPKADIRFDLIRKNAEKAYIQQANNRLNQEELSQWLRFSDAEARQKADGLPAELLGLRGIIKSLYYLTTSRASAKGDRFTQQSIDSFIKQLQHMAGVFILTGKGDPDGWIQTGMNMQAFWLMASQHDIALHPMSQLIEESPFKDEIQEKLGLDEPVQMIFRAGYVESLYGQNQRIRRPLSQFVFSEKR